ncbi:MAG: type VI secretion system protein TssA [Terriglobia bacterium]
MSLPDNLLNPIPGDNPSGESLRYTPVSKRDPTFFYDKIKEARREEEDVGEYNQEGKRAEFDVVIKLCVDAIASRSKDIQIAAWLAEALLKTERFPGFKEGLDLLRGMLENFWDSLYPELEDGDVELRAVPLDWIGQLGAAVRLSPLTGVKSPLTKSGFNWFEYKDSTRIPSEQDADSSESKRKARETAVQENKVLPEQFEEAFAATPKAFYRALAGDVDGLLEALQSLDEVCNEKFGSKGPSFSSLRTAFEEVNSAVRTLLKRKLELEPDPVAPSTEETAAESAAQRVAGAATSSAPARAGFVSLPSGMEAVAVEFAGREEALAQLLAAAHYLRRQRPSDPLPYLVLRAVRWGELRASGPELDPLIFEAPPIEVRQQLKRAVVVGNWAEVLETAESAVGMTCGRAWLDPHRYVVKACAQQGYDAVASAVKSQLRALLAEYPRLMDAVMLDDTGAANPETQAWLREEVLVQPG